MDRDFAAILSLAIGLGLIGLGLRNQTRPFHRTLATYRQANSPFYIRNGAIGQIPIGIGFVLWGIAMVSSHPLLGLLFAFAGLMAFGVAAWIMYRPPSWARPAWMSVIDGTEPRAQNHIGDTIVVVAYLAILLSGLVAFVVLLIVE